MKYCARGYGGLIDVDATQTSCSAIHREFYSASNLDRYFLFSPVVHNALSASKRRLIARPRFVDKGAINCYLSLIF